VARQGTDLPAVDDLGCALDLLARVHKLLQKDLSAKRRNGQGRQVMLPFPAHALHHGLLPCVPHPTITHPIPWAYLVGDDNVVLVLERRAVHRRHAVRLALSSRRGTRDWVCEKFKIQIKGQGKRLNANRPQPHAVMCLDSEYIERQLTLARHGVDRKV
jgi:hypothetical protein